MRQFLTKTLVFSVILLGLAFLLDFVFSHFLKKSNKAYGEYEVWNDIYSSKASCEIAIYGSSRAWVHIAPKIISDSLDRTAYNFGIDGHNFWLQYLRHKEFLRFNEKPDVIILSLDVFGLKNKTELYNSDQFLPHMLYNKNIYSYTSTYVGFKKIDYCLPLIRYAGKIHAFSSIFKVIINGKDLTKYRTKGFRGMDKKWNSDLEKVKKKMQYYEATFDKSNIALFEKFINECDQSGIKLVLVYTPEYMEGQKFVLNRGNVISIYRDYSLKYNLPFLDYSEDEICLDKNFFYNATHLNARGAKMFSRKLGHDLKNLKLFN